MRLLRLQEEWVVAVAAEHEHDQARADAADADNLARRIDEAEPLEQCRRSPEASAGIGGL